jgi:hypothetical protein
VESLCSAAAVLAYFVHAPAGRREEHLLSARALIREAIECGVRRGVAVALTMAQTATDVELQDVEGFPMGEGWETTRTSLRASSRQRTSLLPLSARTRSSTRTCRLSLGPLPSPKNVKEIFI